MRTYMDDCDVRSQRSNICSNKNLNLAACQTKIERQRSAKLNKLRGHVTRLVLWPNKGWKHDLAGIPLQSERSPSVLQSQGQDNYWLYQLDLAGLEVGFKGGFVKTESDYICKPDFCSSDLKVIIKPEEKHAISQQVILESPGMCLHLLCFAPPQTKALR